MNILSVRMISSVHIRTMLKMLCTVVGDPSHTLWMLLVNNAHSF